MDPLLTALANFGGMGLVSAVLLWLHHNAIQAFREDQMRAREQHEKNWTRVLDIATNHHNSVVAKLEEHGKALAEINVRLKG